MKNPIILLVLLFAVVYGQAQEIEWMSWTEAVEKTQTEKKPKKIFVDVYTDWCGWCKKMDKDTFNNPEVAAYMKDNFYMVKMDAESKDDVVYKNKTFKFISQGRSGYHELAAALLQGKMSFPTVIFLNEKQEILSPVPGYQKPKGFLKIAKYFGDDIYKNKDWKEYDAEKS
ncbi:thioredoxin family protein [Galbibacter mesophilus]|uniref:thioredoxin family protein n=1 Tax=Galbibacter mesophilus TaxID=379069 RepID=UPI001920052A|nr:DUF255 domain-containing protein [Galbibacter mesophilus]MCM5663164.1 DUF255 domain-containing protein [Galbibacter mesophilus]